MILMARLLNIRCSINAISAASSSPEKVATLPRIPSVPWSRGRLMKSLSYRTVVYVGPTDGDIGPNIAIDTQDSAGITDRIAPDLHTFS